MEVYAAVRDFVFNQEKSRREAARVFGLSRETVAKMCRFSLPPGYTRTKPVEKPKLGSASAGDRCDPGGGSDVTGEAASYGEADSSSAFVTSTALPAATGVVKDHVRLCRARGPGGLCSAGASARAPRRLTLARRPR